MKTEKNKAKAELLLEEFAGDPAHSLEGWIRLLAKVAVFLLARYINED